MPGMMGPQLELMPHERMVLHAHPHWWYFWKQVLAGLAILLLFLATYWVGDGLATVLGWMVVIGGVVWLASTLYTERVAFQSGIIRRRGVSIPLNRINNVNFSQGLIARLLNNGIVVIESAGETGDSVFENIRDPSHVRGVIFEQIEADEQADSERDAAALAQVMRQHASSGSPSAPTVEDRLRRLTNLRDDGLVSDDEYARKRAEILNEL
jgi:uncharacterized membrane protein YdbT with pleckstrin-like domain